MDKIFSWQRAERTLDFTGERWTSEVSGKIKFEHIHRYLFARDLCRGKDVLDIACGEGYGAALLGRVARRVIGVDIDRSSVSHAAAEHAEPNLHYVAADARRIPLASGTIDVVVSFETFEHFAEQEAFLAELRRVLRPDGLLVISTPDSEVYSPIGRPADPFHVRELSREEFAATLSSQFRHVVMLTQRPLIGSEIVRRPSDAPSPPVVTYERRDYLHFECSPGLPLAVYLIACASQWPIEEPLSTSLYLHGSQVDVIAQKPAVQDELTAVQAELSAARAELVGLRAESLELAEFRTQAASRQRAMQELQRHAKMLRDRLRGIEASTTWRATAVVRATAMYFPRPVRHNLRRVAKVAYWVLTPHRTLSRIRYLRQRRHAANSGVYSRNSYTAANISVSQLNNLPRNFPPPWLLGSDRRRQGLVGSQRPDLSDPTFDRSAVRGGSSASRRKIEILVAADYPPLFDQSSGGFRLKALINVMAELGWSIIFGSTSARNNLPGVLAIKRDRERYEKALRDAGVSCILYGIDEINDFLSRIAWRLDWAFLSLPDVAIEVMPLVRSHCPLARIAFDMVGFHALRTEREAMLRRDNSLRLETERLRKIELACAQAADITFAISTEEKEKLIEFVPRAVVEVLSNVFEPPARPPPGPIGRTGLLFVGGFWPEPNIDAIHWFVNAIWPIIYRQSPGVVLRIAGSNASEEALALGTRPGIEVLGFVPDVASLFDSHRVFVAPLRYGADMQGKVGQSMAYGLPVVTTTIGAEGMGLRGEVHVLIADQEVVFADHVLRLLRDDTLWARLSASGCEYIGRTLSAEVARSQLGVLLGG